MHFIYGKNDQKITYANGISNHLLSLYLFQPTILFEEHQGCQTESLMHRFQIRVKGDIVETARRILFLWNLLPFAASVH